MLTGISRTYRPKDEEGEQLPPESKKVEVKAEEIIRKTSEVLAKLFDVTATKDWTKRIETLQQAVKFAREEANNFEVEEQRVGERILQFIFR